MTRKLAPKKRCHKPGGFDLARLYRLEHSPNSSGSNTSCAWCHTAPSPLGVEVCDGLQQLLGDALDLNLLEVAAHVDHLLQLAARAVLRRRRRCASQQQSDGAMACQHGCCTMQSPRQLQRAAHRPFLQLAARAVLHSRRRRRRQYGLYRNGAIKQDRVDEAVGQRCLPVAYAHSDQPLLQPRGLCSREPCCTCALWDYRAHMMSRWSELSTATTHALTRHG
jgi:hypothetical protein